MLFELLKSINDIAGYLIIVLIFAMVIYGGYRMFKRRKPEEISRKYSTNMSEIMSNVPSEEFVYPAGIKQYDLIVDPKEFKRFRTKLESAGLQYQQNLSPLNLDKYRWTIEQKGGLHVRTRTEKKIDCALLRDMGILMDFTIFPEEAPEQVIKTSLPLIPEAEQLIVESENKIEQDEGGDEMSKQDVPAKKVKKKDLKRTISIVYKEEFSKEWSVDDIQKAIVYKLKSQLDQILPEGWELKVDED